MYKAVKLGIQLVQHFVGRSSVFSVGCKTNGNLAFFGIKSRCRIVISQKDSHLFFKGRLANTYNSHIAGNNNAFYQL